MDELKLPEFEYDSESVSDSKVTEWENQMRKQDLMKYYINNSGVGKKYLDKSLENYITETDEQKDILQKVREFIEKVNNGLCRTLWLCGKTGTGKTLIGACICLETMGTFKKSYEIKDDIDTSKTFKATETKRMVIDRYANYHLLVIDEIGRGGNEERDYLWQILNERYERELSTVLITNMSKMELKMFLGETVYDRFVTNCTSLTFTGESYRKREREV